MYEPISREVPSISSSLLVSILAFLKNKLILYPELPPTFSIHFSHDTINDIPETETRDPRKTGKPGLYLDLTKH